MEGNKAKGRVTTMDFRKKDLVHGPAWKHPKETLPERKGAQET